MENANLRCPGTYGVLVTQNETTTFARDSPELPPAAPQTAVDPFRTFGVVGFVLSLFAIVNIAGLVVSIVALVRSRRAGFRNGFALAGTVISSIGVVITVIVGGIVVSTFVDAAQTCGRLGTGVHVVGSSTYTCTPTSFYVSFGTPPAALPDSAGEAGGEEWAEANSLYSDATCPTNAAREELYVAVAANDITTLVPVADAASRAFADAADVFLNSAWPAEIEKDIQLLGETSAQLAESWGKVAATTDVTAAEAVPFPDAQRPFEAAQRIRESLSDHGQESLGC